MTSIRFVSVRGAVGRCFLPAFLFGTALLAGCAVFSPSPAGTFALDESAAREAGAMALYTRALLAQQVESEKGTNADFSAGVDDLFHAHALLPDNAEILSDYLTLAERAGRHAEAYRCLDAYLRRHPDAGAEYHLTAAHFADRAKFYAEAADACTRYLALCPTNRAIADARVRVLFDAGRDRDALRALRGNRAYFHDADATNAPLAWAFLFGRERKEPARARACFQLCLETLNDNPAGRASVLAMIGETYCEEGGTNEALRIWHTSYRLSPSVLPARLAGEAQSADPARFAKLRKAAHRASADAETLIQYAAALVNRLPEDGEARAGSLFNCGYRNLAEAVEILGDLCARADSVGLGRDDALFHWRLLVAGELLSARPPEDAPPLPFGGDDLVKVAREMIARFPESAAAKNFLAYYWAERGENLEEAHKLVNEALRLDPESAAILDTKGWILFKLDRPYQAIQFLVKAAEAERSSEIFQHAADVLRSLGRDEEAEKFEKAIK